MEEILNQIFNEIKDIKASIKDFDKKLEEQSKKFDKKLEEQSKKFDKKLEEQSKIFNIKLDIQSNEIAQELRNIVDYICNRYDKKINELDEKINKEIENNKVSHDGYNAKMYKIELCQSNLESKVYDLESSKKVSNNV